MTKEYLDARFFLKKFWPDAEDNTVQLWMDMAVFPNWGKCGWHGEIPGWLRKNWKFLTSREKALVFVWASKLHNEKLKGE